MKSNQRSISVFLPALAGGGAERAMLHLADGMARHGFKTDLVVAEGFGAYLDQVPAGVRLVDLQAKPPVVVSKTLALSRYLKTEQPTILFAALDIFSAALWAKWLSHSPTRVVMCVQTFLSEQFRDHQPNTVGRVRPLMVRWLYPKSDLLVAASQGTATDLAQITSLPVDRIQVIYNPVITPDVPSKSQAAIAHPWFAPDQPPVILGVGRLVSQKDFFTLIRAFVQVRQNRPARLVILGEGEQRPELEALIRDCQLEDDVALLGFVENPYAYMAKAAVFVLSSRYEGFGNVVAEALATGTSVVSTDCPSGPAEILDWGKYGKLVPIAEPTQMAIAILETLDQPIDPTQLQARSQAFTCDRIIEQYLEVVEQLMQSN